MLTNTPLKRSLYLFLFAFVAFLITGVLLDSTLASVSNTIQRGVTFVLVILPTLAGTVLAVISLFREPRKVLVSVFLFLLNLLTALFFTFLILFAG